MNFQDSVAILPLAGCVRYSFPSIITLATSLRVYEVTSNELTCIWIQAYKATKRGRSDGNPLIRLECSVSNIPYNPELEFVFPQHFNHVATRCWKQKLY